MKKRFALLLVLAMMFAMTLTAHAAEPVVVVSETVTFTSMWDPASETTWTAPSDGTLTITVDEEASTGDWAYAFGLSPYPEGMYWSDSDPSTQTFDVVGGTTYLLAMMCNTTPGDVVYSATFTAAGDGSGDGGDVVEPSGPVEVQLEQLTFNMVKIPAGQTYILYLDDSANAWNGIYQRHINVLSTTDKAAGYTVVCQGETIQSDADGYANKIAYAMGMGTYSLEITNNSEAEATFFVNFYDVAEYSVSGTMLVLGENAVVSELAATTIYEFVPAEAGVYEIKVDDAYATISKWNGSSMYVTGLDYESESDTITVTCTAAEQPVLVGISGVDSCNITVTKTGDYTPEPEIEWIDYENTHTPDGSFELVLEEGQELVNVDITEAQEVYLGEDGYCHLGSPTGPILYVDLITEEVNMEYAFYPPEGTVGAAITLRGILADEDGNVVRLDFYNSMREYVNAVKGGDGLYPMTEDLALFLMAYGTAQGWYMEGLSPFDAINNGEANADSVWLALCSYVPEAEEDTTPENPENPEDPELPPAAPETGDVSFVAPIIVMVVAAVAFVAFVEKKRRAI